MIFSTIKRKTNAYSWNTGTKMNLDKGVYLSDYTGLEKEFGQKTLKETFDSVCSKNKDLIMKSPSLMLITTGVHQSCRVWIDKSLLKMKSEIDVPKKDFEYYSEQ